MGHTPFKRAETPSQNAINLIQRCTPEGPGMCIFVIFRKFIHHTIKYMSNTPPVQFSSKFVFSLVHGDVINMADFQKHVSRVAHFPKNGIFDFVLNFILKSTKSKLAFKRKISMCLELGEPWCAPQYRGCAHPREVVICLQPSRSALIAIENRLKIITAA